jgi:hypothetical protein
MTQQYLFPNVDVKLNGATYVPVNPTAGHINGIPISTLTTLPSTARVIPMNSNGAAVSFVAPPPPPTINFDEDDIINADRNVAAAVVTMRSTIAPTAIPTPTPFPTAASFAPFTFPQVTTISNGATSTARVLPPTAPVQMRPPVQQQPQPTTAAAAATKRAASQSVAATPKRRGRPPTSKRKRKGGDDDDDDDEEFEDDDDDDDDGNVRMSVRSDLLPRSTSGRQRKPVFNDATNGNSMFLDADEDDEGIGDVIRAEKEWAKKQKEEKKDRAEIVEPTVSVRFARVSF